MAKGTALKLNERRVCADLKDFQGSGQDEFYLVSGARLLVTLRILDAEPGVAVYATFGTAEVVDGPFDEFRPIELRAAGVAQEIYSDFNSIVRVKYRVLFGKANVRISVQVLDVATTPDPDTFTNSLLQLQLLGPANPISYLIDEESFFVVSNEGDLLRA